jgi:DNA polymerase V
MLALVDCNNFYASCERAFNPRLEGKPVIVLSNNDGCAIARSNEAKALGIRMGQPFHEINYLVQTKGVQVYSANFALYGDLSRRVMGTLQQFSDAIEVYSVDEAFISLNGFEQRGLLEYGQQIRQTVKAWTHIPVSIGIAPTKTLCKVAGNLAKKTFIGVMVLDDEASQTQALANTPIADVWGVGRQYAQKLYGVGIRTALQLRDASDAELNLLINNVNMGRTVRELRGIPCIDLELLPPTRKGIMTSRAFGQPLYALQGLQEAVASYTARACFKMRQHKLSTNLVQVMLQTNPFRQWEPQHHPHTVLKLPVPTNCTHEISRYTQMGLHSIFAAGYAYHKAVVMMLDLVPENQEQQSLFHTVDREKTARLMQTLDKLNGYYGPGTLRYASEGTAKTPDWHMKQSHKSKRFTTHLSELWEV